MTAINKSECVQLYCAASEVIYVTVINKSEYVQLYQSIIRVGIAQWLESQTHDWKVTGLNPCWSGGIIFFSRVDFLCWFLFRYPFHPRVTTAARKRPQPFCQKRRWQVTAKHAYTLCMWLCMKWHEAWLYGVHRTWAEMAAVSCGTSHASAVGTPLQWIFKKRTIKLVTHRTTCERSESAQESGEYRYISDHQSIN